MTGIIIVDKPEGWTSQDVAAKLRGVYHEKHVGHGGTLDPMATGVLPVFLGRATRAVPFFEHAEKEYIADIRFGMETDTQDTTGNVLRESPIRPAEEDVRRTLASMEGPQLQVPPMYSAVKIGGKKLYELARAGQEVERKARAIELKELELLRFYGDGAQFRVRCSKGTYVRTICADLGTKLGCGACMSGLRRTAAGVYRIEKAFTMDQILEGSAEVLPVDSMFSAVPSVRLTEAQQERCFHGNAIAGLKLAEGEYRVYGPGGNFLMLGTMEQGMLKTHRSFFEVDERGGK